MIKRRHEFERELRGQKRSFRVERVYTMYVQYHISVVLMYKLLTKKCVYKVMS